MPGGKSVGPRDPREVEGHDDDLVYSTDAQEQPVGVIGPVELRLFVSSSALDTEFTGKLVDVHPDGRATVTPAE